MDKIDIGSLKQFEMDMKYRAPRWMDDYLKKGATVFSAGEIMVFTKIKERYAVDYIPFLQKLAAGLKTKEGRTRPRQAEILRDIGNTVKVMESVGALVDKITQRTSPAELATAEDVRGFFTVLASMEDKMAQYVDFAKQDAVFRKVQAEVSKETGVSFESIKKTGGVVGREVRKFTPEMTAAERLQRAAPRTYGAASQLIGGTVGAMLGPYGKMAQAAVQEIRGIVQRRREAKINREREQFAGELLKTSEYSPEGVRDMYGKLSDMALGGRAGTVKPGGMWQQRTPGTVPMREMATQQASPRFRIGGTDEYLDPAMAQKMGLPGMMPEPAMAGAGGGMGLLGSKKGSANVGMFAQGLLFFFNRGAYQARWTKELLDFAKKGSLGHGIQQTMSGVLGKVLTPVRGLIAGIGALFGGFAKLGGGSALMGLAKGGLWGGLIKGGAGLVGASALAKAIPMLGRFAGILGRFAGPIGWAITAAQAGFGAFKGAKQAGAMFGTEKASFGQKVAAGLGGALQALTFGLLKQENVAKFLHVPSWGKKITPTAPVTAPTPAVTMKPQALKNQPTATPGRLWHGMPADVGVKRTAQAQSVQPTTDALAGARSRGQLQTEWAMADEMNRRKVSAQAATTAPAKKGGLITKVTPILSVPAVRGVITQTTSPIDTVYRGTMSKMDQFIQTANAVISKIPGGGTTTIPRVRNTNIYSGRDPVIDLLNTGKLQVFS